MKFTIQISNGWSAAFFGLTVLLWTNHMLLHAIVLIRLQLMLPCLYYERINLWDCREQQLDGSLSQLHTLQVWAKFMSMLWRGVVSKTRQWGGVKLKATACIFLLLQKQTKGISKLECINNKYMSIKSDLLSFFIWQFTLFFFFPRC